MKRLVLCFDGTWNDPDDNTNVWRLRLMLADQDSRGTQQLAYYDPGVGTAWYDHVPGGAFGSGLSKNIREGYQWLMEHYDDGDEIFLLGFSRGAFTARSLVGFISRCGLLRPGAPIPTIQLFERYRRGDAAKPIYKLEFEDRHGGGHFTREERWMLEHSRRRPDMIKFVGVWDTVGALGIPDLLGYRWSARASRFHNTHLSNTVSHSYQALALDEHRGPYAPTLWTRFTPQGATPKPSPPAIPQHVEQRWFIGAHSNVGGGYRDDPLAQIPLAWLQEKAKACALAFRHEARLRGDEEQADPRDSFGEFLGGLYRIAARRFHRPLRAARRQVREGSVETVCETIDETVFSRCRARRDYRPPSLLDWAARTGVSLEDLIADPSRWSKA